MSISLLIALLSGVGDASELPLASKLLMKHLELVDELFTHRGEDIPGRDRSVRLHTNEQVRHVGVSDYGQVVSDTSSRRSK